VVATAEHGTLFATPGIMYMDKICVGAGAVGAIDINASVADNIHSVARALGKDVNDLTVILLERPRHAELVEEIRATGARIRKIAHGEVLAALMAVGEEPTVDILIGVGGAPETVVIACLLLCAGGEIQARLWPRNGAERELVARDNIDITRVYTTTDLCRGEDVAFAATGITSSDGLRGVQYTAWGARTQSVVTRSRSGTVRVIESRHPNRKLAMLGDTTVPTS
jgi:fructose-1,6-bisphosphatase II